MNERIKDLIEQATVRGEEYLPGNDGHPTPTVYFDKEKFAELIVRECISLCEEVDDINKTYLEVRHIDTEFGPKECIKVIKTYFGVEE